MLEPDVISETLEALSDGDTAKRRSKHLKPFRGLRGTPVGEIARVCADSWAENRTRLPRDSDGLHELFLAAHEDGLVAIGLTAAAVPDAPHEALDLVDRWLLIIDDLESADALGWLVLGPALLAGREPFAQALCEHARHPKSVVRRISVMACLAALPIPIEGPSAAALRARLGQKRVAFVDAPQVDAVLRVLRAYVRDQDPHVRKALGRVGRTLAEQAPERLDELMGSIQGGLPKSLKLEWLKGVKKGRRLAKQDSPGRNGTIPSRKDPATG
ncbi:MAG: DNA alkylation repair protein [Proteobacteria bacterium]|nr:DNA alkylation repair protein [Pseudomonadota bacterium]MCP4917961.1 DNA alkylation repair protein [Pseudomonadota bacterium]